METESQNEVVADNGSCSHIAYGIKSHESGFLKSLETKNVDCTDSGFVQSILWEQYLNLDAVASVWR